jgi:membrane-associated phospholipid phosphatase
MKKLITFCLSVITIIPTVYSQDTTLVTQDTVQITLPDTTIQTTAALLGRDPNNYSPSQNSTSPYKVTFKKDAPIIAAGIGLTALGTYLIGQKDSLTNAQLAAKTRDKVPFFDRGNAGYYSEKADDDSYIPFKLSFAWPVVMALINKNERHDIAKVLTLYVETMAVTGTLFTMSTGTIYRSRPLVYGTIASPSKRRENDSQRSFFAGHTAATAAATFFTAKVFQDYNPDSKLKPVIWLVAAATPAIVAYGRYKAGMHFLSDNLLGYAIGAGAGILIPEWHKNRRSDNLSIVPEVGNGYKGLAISYKF